MPLVTLNEVLSEAEDKKIAIGAFNIANYESCKAVFDSAKELKLPVILQIFRRLVDNEKARDLAGLVRSMAEDMPYPVVLHMDHGNSLFQVEKAIRYGFTSVMIDGSELPLQQNINLTREVVIMAHQAGLSVEAELGHIPAQDKGDTENFLTVPDEAKIFVRETSVDALAIAIGTAHGKYLVRPKLDFERLKTIHSLLNVPLVLHGGSDTPADDIKQAIKMGIRKVNVATDFHRVFIDEVAKQAEAHKNKFSPIDLYMHPVYEGMRNLVLNKLLVLSDKI